MSWWPRDIAGSAWPHDDLDDLRPEPERVYTGSIRAGRCEACGGIHRETGLSDRDGLRICPTCLHERRARS